MSGSKSSALPAQGEETVAKPEAQKRCPQCKLQFPRSAYSHAGWSGRGWCQQCRDKYSRQTATRRSILSAEGQIANGGHGQGKAAADGGTVVQRARRTKRAQPQQHGQTSTLQRSSNMPTMSGARYQSGNGLGARNDALGAKRGRSASSDPRLSLDRRETYSRYSFANSAKTVYGHWENSASTYNAGGSNRNEMRASKVQRLSGGDSISRYQENMGAEQSASRDAAYMNIARDVRSYGARDVVNLGSLAVDGDTEQSWVIGGTNGKRNESCVPFLGARVRVSTKLGQGSVDSYFNATVAAYLPPTWGTGVKEQALWRVVFDHPCITPQDLDVDELLASAAMYTSFVRKRQSFEPVQRALPENVMAAAATAAGKFGVSGNGLPPSEAASDATGKGWGVGGLGNQNSLVKDMMGWTPRAGTGGLSGRSRPFTCSDFFLGGSERDLPIGSIGDGGDDNGNIGCLSGMGGGAVDMLKLKDLDLEGMFILRVLPDHGEVVGEVTAQSNGGDTFEISYESGAVEQLSIKDLATSLRATMALSRSDGWGVPGSGLVRRITPSLAGVSAAQREFMTARAASGCNAEAGKAGSSEKEVQPPKTALGGSVATEEGVGVNDVNGILLRQERAALYVQMNDTVMCECNGSLLVGRVCQLKPGKAKVHVSGFKARHDLWLDLTSPRLLPLPRRDAEGPLAHSAEFMRPVNSISGAEERRHFAAVRDALGLDTADSQDTVGDESSEAWMGRRRTTSSLNSAGFRVPASKKVPLPCLLANCSGLPKAALQAARQGLQRSLETTSSITQLAAEDTDSSGPIVTATASVIDRSAGAAQGGDLAVKSRAHFLASPASCGPAPMMIGLGGDPVRSGWTSGGGNSGEGYAATRTLGLSGFARL